MTRSVLISVIIPTLNEEKFVGNLLEDLKKQRWDRFEVIVVNGLSKDATGEVVRSFIGKIQYLRLVQSLKNGVSKQRNLGARQAKGDLLVFLDADIRIPEDFLEKVWQEFSQKRLGIATVVSYPDSIGFFPRLSGIVKNYLVAIFRRFWPIIYGWTMVVQKNWFEKVFGFNEEIRFAEDIDFCQRVVKEGGRFGLLKSTKVLVSDRRRVYEGRLGMRRKQLTFFIEYLKYWDIGKAAKFVNWKTGDFSRLSVF